MQPRWVFLGLILGSVVALRAAESPPPVADDFQRVELVGLHLCCATCVSAVRTALVDVPGVSDVQVKLASGRASFRFVEQGDLEAALDAVRLAGFYGEAQRLGETIDWPIEKLSPEACEDRLVFRGVHLCCKGCATAVAKALAEIEEIESVDCDLERGTVTLAGDEIPVALTRGRLLAAGFYGRVERPIVARIQKSP